MSGVSYKGAGVDRAAGEKTKEAIKRVVDSTHTEAVLKGIGLFSGFLKFPAAEYRNPVLVSSIDGVGTKIKVAQLMGRYGSIGEDLVNHCVNDIMVCGAEPLFFLDYIAADTLDTDVVLQLVSGMAKGCKQAGCSLVGGETAEMPGVYRPQAEDVAGCIVGVVEEDEIIDGTRIRPGDKLIGIASTGLHTNGYSLARKIVLERHQYDLTQSVPGLSDSIGNVLLKVHRSYAEVIGKIKRIDHLHGIAHITGGGIEANTARLLPSGLSLQIDWSCWRPPEIFTWLQAQGKVQDSDMRETFNMGIGLVLVCAPEGVEQIRKIGLQNEQHWIIGEVAKT